MHKLHEEWREFLIFPVDSNPSSTLDSFSFQLPIAANDQLHRLKVHVTGGEGASLFIRFFYGLRNILSHGDPAQTFWGSLREFVGDADLVTGDKPSDSARSAVLKNSRNALDKYGCSVAENEGNLSLEHVAKWLTDKICEFTRYGQRVRVSTLLLETMSGFLVAVVHAYATRLAEQVTKAHKFSNLS